MNNIDNYNYNHFSSYGSCYPITIAKTSNTKFHPLLYNKYFENFTIMYQYPGESDNKYNTLYPSNLSQQSFEKPYSTANPVYVPNKNQNINRIPSYKLPTSTCNSCAK
jgi:hypothetical protein